MICVIKRYESMNRRRLFEILSLPRKEDRASCIYNYFMILVIVISIIPLMFKHSNDVFRVIDIVSVTIFIIDYVLRFSVADYSLQKGVKSFAIYPFTFLAIVDLASILPSFNIIASGYRLLKLFRLLRVFRVFKLFRYSKNIVRIVNVMKNERRALLAVGVLAIGYVFAAALVVFNVEPDTFNNFFEAVYWAVVSLTTMGYGDIYPVTMTGRVVTILSAFIGIAIVALPSGIITAGYMNELAREKKESVPEQTVE